MNWDLLDEHKFSDENNAASSLITRINLFKNAQNAINAHAVRIVHDARALAKRKGLMETFLEEFGLSNKEGLALMCLAESLLRVPDAKTADKLIAEKISSGEWDSHMGQSESWLVNASTLGLMLTGRVVDIEPEMHGDVRGFMHKLTNKAGAPVIRKAMMQAMRIMGEQFVVGRTIGEAMERAASLGPKKTRELCSFDMLGEGARTFEDAERYRAAYERAIIALSEQLRTDLPEDMHGISVKLSALHPRYDALHYEDVMTQLYPSLLGLAELAAKANLNLCLDAEEADRLVISLKLLDKLSREPSLNGWNGLGLAVQAYQKRAPYVIDHLITLARDTGHRLMIRLVKGAYWDTEIKHAQEAGHPDFPVWTRKSTTDLAYLACARKMLEAGDAIYPQFATHNAHSVAAIQAMAKTDSSYEFQRLHGMGDALYNAVNTQRPVRVYAPVGAHEDLLPYLVRRLLENGANTSFVHSFLDEDVAPEDVARSPFTDKPLTRHPAIPAPLALFGETRKAAIGCDYSQVGVQTHITERYDNFTAIDATSLTAIKSEKKAKAETRFSPVDAKPIGTSLNASADDVPAIVAAARGSFMDWNTRGGAARADILNTLADLIEADMDDILVLLGREAGKTTEDGIAEIREAVDFCRYYGAQARATFTNPVVLPGPAGETNHLSLSGRGTFVCISPWNFPFAIFLGQITAALAAGNSVIAKPAEQTPLTAYVAAKLIHKAGVPKDVFQLVLGEGDIGAALTAAPGITGVCFTGSTEVAKLINMTLAQKDGPIPVLIAETGGLNPMFVDTTALREQVIDDVIGSAFNAAGQRCSALRVLFVPEHTAGHIIDGIIGAMNALHIGDPKHPETDIGPVIDHDALKSLQDYITNLPASMKLIHQCELPPACKDGTFMPPTLIEMTNLADIKTETFGPVLHVMRYKEKHLDKLMADYAAKNYGLTLGIHSRLERFAQRVSRAVPSGNVYINRNVIGAVVGVQPFGGRGLSGTGPKAGGPHYLPRFATEVTVTNNISAQGGDPALLNLEE